MPKDRSTHLAQPVFGEPTFSEDAVTPDPSGFTKLHSSDTDTYKQIQDLLKKDVVDFAKKRGKPDDLYKLEDAMGTHGPDMVKGILKTGQIIFHAAGDTGASNAQKYKNEIRVADQLTNDCQISDPKKRPMFFYHLGDVVYNFGEAQYYYDQFYEPFRNYPGPIFGIPGNHDSFVVPYAAEPPLDVFTRNFCAESPNITPEAASLHRTAMTQPGIYYTLDAPFVRIIGLFSNSLEDPGVISSGAQLKDENWKWEKVPDFQIEYLRDQLQRIKDEDYKGAVLLAMHHPPFSYSPPPEGSGTGGNHSSSSHMLREIDMICKEVGVYPHAFLSGHAHNYQRYTRTVQFEKGKDAYDVPFIVCGDGGHNVNLLVRTKRGEPSHEPSNGSKVDYLEAKNTEVDARGLLLEKYDDHNYGHLRITVDKDYLRIGFHQVGVSTLAQSRFDLVTVELKSHTMVAN
jgi:Calcineurin-like phosphoesterase